MAITKKAVALIGLALMVAALIPASASANASGTELPYKASDTGWVSLNLLTSRFTAERTGEATYLGEYTLQFANGRVEWITVGVEANIYTEFTLVAANGDELTGTAVGVAKEFSSAGHTTSAVATIEGGTGRFEGATGTLYAVDHDKQISNAGGFLVSSSESTYTGEINLNR